LAWAAFGIGERARLLPEVDGTNFSLVASPSLTEIHIEISTNTKNKTNKNKILISKLRNLGSFSAILACTFLTNSNLNVASATNACITCTLQFLK
jgi:hypothetical protein